METVANIELPTPYMQGNTDSYSIDYGNGLMEVGGTVEINFADTKESQVDINIPFKTLLNAHCNVLDIQGYYAEGCHLELLSDAKIRIYGHTQTKYTGVMKVMYSMKGQF